MGYSRPLQPIRLALQAPPRKRCSQHLGTQPALDLQDPSVWSGEGDLIQNSPLLRHQFSASQPRESPPGPDNFNFLVLILPVTDTPQSEPEPSTTRVLETPSSKMLSELRSSFMQKRKPKRCPPSPKQAYAFGRQLGRCWSCNPCLCPLILALQMWRQSPLKPGEHNRDQGGAPNSIPEDAKTVNFLGQ